MPLTGKLLCRPAQPSRPSQQDCSLHEVFRSALEAQLVALWEPLLALAPIGIHDDFFALGGHSLLGAALLAQVRHICQADLPLRWRSAAVA